MPKLPKKITIDRKASKLLIDGTEFPYFITEQGPEVEGALNSSELPRVTITIFTEDLEVIPADKDS